MSDYDEDFSDFSDVSLTNKRTTDAAPHSAPTAAAPAQKEDDEGQQQGNSGYSSFGDDDDDGAAAAPPPAAAEAASGTDDADADDGYGDDVFEDDERDSGALNEQKEEKATTNIKLPKSDGEEGRGPMADADGKGGDDAAYEDEFENDTDSPHSQKQQQQPSPSEQQPQTATTTADDAAERKADDESVLPRSPALSNSFSPLVSVSREPAPSATATTVAVTPHSAANTTTAAIPPAPAATALPPPVPAAGGGGDAYEDDEDFIRDDDSDEEDGTSKGEDTRIGDEKKGEEEEDPFDKAERIAEETRQKAAAAAAAAEAAASHNSSLSANNVGGVGAAPSLSTSAAAHRPMSAAKRIGSAGASRPNTASRSRGPPPPLLLSSAAAAHLAPSSPTAGSPRQAGSPTSAEGGNEGAAAPSAEGGGALLPPSPSPFSVNLGGGGGLPPRHPAGAHPATASAAAPLPPSSPAQAQDQQSPVASIIAAATDEGPSALPVHVVAVSEGSVPPLSAEAPIVPIMSTAGEEETQAVPHSHDDTHPASVEAEASSSAAFSPAAVADANTTVADKAHEVAPQQNAVVASSSDDSNAAATATTAPLQATTDAAPTATAKTTTTSRPASSGGTRRTSGALPPQTTTASFSYSYNNAVALPIRGGSFSRASRPTSASGTRPSSAAGSARRAASPANASAAPSSNVTGAGGIVNNDKKSALSAAAATRKAPLPRVAIKRSSSVASSATRTAAAVQQRGKGGSRRGSTASAQQHKQQKSSLLSAADADHSSSITKKVYGGNYGQRRRSPPPQPFDVPAVQSSADIFLSEETRRDQQLVFKFLQLLSDLKIARGGGSSASDGKEKETAENAKGEAKEKKKKRTKQWEAFGDDEEEAMTSASSSGTSSSSDSDDDAGSPSRPSEAPPTLLDRLWGAAETFSHQADAFLRRQSGEKDPNEAEASPLSSASSSSTSSTSQQQQRTISSPSSASEDSVVSSASPVSSPPLSSDASSTTSASSSRASSSSAAASSRGKRPSSAALRRQQLAKEEKQAQKNKEKRERCRQRHAAAKKEKGDDHSNGQRVTAKALRELEKRRHSSASASSAKGHKNSQLVMIGGNNSNNSSPTLAAADRSRIESLAEDLAVLKQRTVATISAIVVRETAVDAIADLATMYESSERYFNIAFSEALVSTRLDEIRQASEAVVAALDTWKAAMHNFDVKYNGVRVTISGAPIVVSDEDDDDDGDDANKEKEEGNEDNDSASSEGNSDNDSENDPNNRTARPSSFAVEKKKGRNVNSNRHSSAAASSVAASSHARSRSTSQHNTSSVATTTTTPPAPSPKAPPPRLRPFPFLEYPNYITKMQKDLVFLYSTALGPFILVEVENNVLLTNRRRVLIDRERQQQLREAEAARAAAAAEAEAVRQAELSAAAARNDVKTQQRHLFGGQHATLSAMFGGGAAKPAAQPVKPATTSDASDSNPKNNNGGNNTPASSSASAGLSTPPPSATAHLGFYGNFDGGRVPSATNLTAEARKNYDAKMREEECSRQRRGVGIDADGLNRRNTALAEAIFGRERAQQQRQRGASPPSAAAARSPSDANDTNNAGINGNGGDSGDNNNALKSSPQQQQATAIAAPQPILPRPISPAKLREQYFFARLSAPSGTSAVRREAGNLGSEGQHWEDMRLVAEVERPTNSWFRGLTAMVTPMRGGGSAKGGGGVGRAASVGGGSSLNATAPLSHHFSVNETIGNNKTNPSPSFASTAPSPAGCSGPLLQGIHRYTTRFSVSGGNNISNNNGGNNTTMMITSSASAGGGGGGGGGIQQQQQQRPHSALEMYASRQRTALRDRLRAIHNGVLEGKVAAYGTAITEASGYNASPYEHHHHNSNSNNNSRRGTASFFSPSEVSGPAATMRLRQVDNTSFLTMDKQRRMVYARPDDRYTSVLSMRRAAAASSNNSGRGQGNASSLVGFVGGSGYENAPQYDSTGRRIGGGGVGRRRGSYFNEIGEDDGDWDGEEEEEGDEDQVSKVPPPVGSRPGSAAAHFAAAALRHRKSGSAVSRDSGGGPADMTMGAAGRRRGGAGLRGAPHPRHAVATTNRDLLRDMRRFEDSHHFWTDFVFTIAMCKFWGRKLRKRARDAQYAIKIQRWWREIMTRERFYVLVEEAFIHSFRPRRERAAMWLVPQNHGRQQMLPMMSNGGGIAGYSPIGSPRGEESAPSASAPHQALLSVVIFSPDGAVIDEEPLVDPFCKRYERAKLLTSAPEASLTAKKKKKRRRQRGKRRSTPTEQQQQHQQQQQAMGTPPLVTARPPRQQEEENNGNSLISSPTPQPLGALGQIAPAISTTSPTADALYARPVLSDASSDGDHAKAGEEEEDDAEGPLNNSDEDGNSHHGGSNSGSFSFYTPRDENHAANADRDEDYTSPSSNESEEDGEGAETAPEAHQLNGNDDAANGNGTPSAAVCAARAAIRRAAAVKKRTEEKRRRREAKLDRREKRRARRVGMNAAALAQLHGVPYLMTAPPPSHSPSSALHMHGDEDHYGHNNYAFDANEYNSYNEAGDYGQQHFYGANNAHNTNMYPQPHQHQHQQQQLQIIRSGAERLIATGSYHFGKNKNFRRNSRSSGRTTAQGSRNATPLPQQQQQASVAFDGKKGGGNKSKMGAASSPVSSSSRSPSPTGSSGYTPATAPSNEERRGGGGGRRAILVGSAGSSIQRQRRSEREAAVTTTDQRRQPHTSSVMMDTIDQTSQRTNAVDEAEQQQQQLREEEMTRLSRLATCPRRLVALAAPVTRGNEWVYGFLFSLVERQMAYESELREEERTSIRYKNYRAALALKESSSNVNEKRVSSSSSVSVSSSQQQPRQRPETGWVTVTCVTLEPVVSRVTYVDATSSDEEEGDGSANNNGKIVHVATAATATTPRPAVGKTSTKKRRQKRVLEEIVYEKPAPPPQRPRPIVTQRPYPPEPIPKSSKKQLHENKETEESEETTNGGLAMATFSREGERATEGADAEEASSNGVNAKAFLEADEGLNDSRTLIADADAEQQQQRLGDSVADAEPAGAEEIATINKEEGEADDDAYSTGHYAWDDDEKEASHSSTANLRRPNGPSSSTQITHVSASTKPPAEVANQHNDDDDTSNKQHHSEMFRAGLVISVTKELREVDIEDYPLFPQAALTQLHIQQRRDEARALRAKRREARRIRREREREAAFTKQLLGGLLLTTGAGTGGGAPSSAAAGGAVAVARRLSALPQNSHAGGGGLLTADNTRNHSSASSSSQDSSSDNEDEGVGGKKKTNSVEEGEDEEGGPIADIACHVRVTTRTSVYPFIAPKATLRHPFRDSIIAAYFFYCRMADAIKTAIRKYLCRKHMRENILRCKAMVRLQRFYHRRFWARRLREEVRQRVAARTIFEGYQYWRDRRAFVAVRREARAANLIRHAWLRFAARRTLCRLRTERDAAIVIQRRARGIAGRQRAATARHCQTVLRFVWPTLVTRPLVIRKMIEKSAATRIQRIYRLYRAGLIFTARKKAKAAALEAFLKADAAKVEAAAHYAIVAALRGYQTRRDLSLLGDSSAIAYNSCSQHLASSSACGDAVTTRDVGADDVDELIGRATEEEAARHCWGEWAGAVAAAPHRWAHVRSVAAAVGPYITDQKNAQLSAAAFTTDAAAVGDPRCFDESREAMLNVFGPSYAHRHGNEAVLKTLLAPALCRRAIAADQTATTAAAHCGAATNSGGEDYATRPRLPAGLTALAEAHRIRAVAGSYEASLATSSCPAQAAASQHRTNDGINDDADGDEPSTVPIGSTTFPATILFVGEANETLRALRDHVRRSYRCGGGANSTTPSPRHHHGRATLHPQAPSTAASSLTPRNTAAAHIDGGDDDDDDDGYDSDEALLRAYDAKMQRRRERCQKRGGDLKQHQQLFASDTTCDIVDYEVDDDDDEDAVTNERLLLAGATARGCYLPDAVLADAGAIDCSRLAPHRPLITRLQCFVRRYCIAIPRLDRLRREKRTRQLFFALWQTQSRFSAVFGRECALKAAQMFKIALWRSQSRTAVARLRSQRAERLALCERNEAASAIQHNWRFRRSSSNASAASASSTGGNNFNANKNGREAAAAMRLQRQNDAAIALRLELENEAAATIQQALAAHCRRMRARRTAAVRRRVAADKLGRWWRLMIEERALLEARYEHAKEREKAALLIQCFWGACRTRRAAMQRRVAREERLFGLRPTQTAAAGGRRALYPPRPHTAGGSGNTKPPSTSAAASASSGGAHSRHQHQQHNASLSTAAAARAPSPASPLYEETQRRHAQQHEAIRRQLAADSSSFAGGKPPPSHGGNNSSSHHHHHHASLYPTAAADARRASIGGGGGGGNALSDLSTTAAANGIDVRRYSYASTSGAVAAAVANRPASAGL